MRIAHAPLERLTGFGRAQACVARVLRPGDLGDVEALFEHVVPELSSLALRGAGRSYGDAALDDGGTVLDLSGLRRVLAFDSDAGVIDVEPGATIADVCRVALPAGWWPPVVPGTARATIGGCVAANVHGKNAARAGTFGRHVREIELWLPGGERRRLDPRADAELYGAVVGGMGWLGCVTRIRLALRRVHSGLLRVRALPARSLAEQLALFEEHADADHLVGWCDAFASGGGVVHRGDELAPGDGPPLAVSGGADAQALPERLLGALPRGWAARALRLVAWNGGVRALNALKGALHALAPRAAGLESLTRFHFLLDHVPGWEGAYGPAGLVQIQPFVPHAARAALERILAEARRRGLPPWLAVLKRHRADEFVLSHGIDGWSLALDFPARDRRALRALAREIHAIALDAGGRFYLAKDSLLTPDEWRRSLSAAALARFAEARRKCDPAGVLQSDLLRRVWPELVGGR
jgi:FAD/FMN-containing dehydrogenase